MTGLSKLRNQQYFPYIHKNLINDHCSALWKPVWNRACPQRYPELASETLSRQELIQL